MNPSLSCFGKILLAEDDTLFGDALASWLRRHDFECLCAPDGATALALLRSEPCDLLISDLNLPGNEGLELISRAREVSPGIPVILLTGKPTVDTAARSVRLAVEAYLVKPPDMNELLGLAREAVVHYRGARSMSRSRERLQAWAAELDQLGGGRPGGSSGQDYLRVTLRNVRLQLAELEQLAGLVANPGAGPRTLDLVAALRDTIEVIEQTRQNFKSRQLGDLRVRLETLLRERRPAKSGE